MRYLKTPNDSTPLSRIALGGAALSGSGGGYGFGEIEEESALHLIQQSLDLGINLFDTAPVYGFGQSELMLGKALGRSSSLREKAFIVDKCGVTWTDQKRIHINNDPKVAKRQLEDSLKKLQTEVIDLYLIHWPDPRVDVRKTYELLAKEKEAGKIKHLGLSNTNLEEISKASEIAPVEFLQGEYNLFNSSAEIELFTWAKENSAPFLAWGTFDKGILTGRVSPDRNYEKSDARSWAPWWKSQDLKSKLSKVESLKKFAKDKNLSLSSIALWSSLYAYENLIALCGYKSIEQLEDILTSLKSKISEDTLEEVKSFFKTDE